MRDLIKRPVVLFVLPWPLHYVGGVNQVVTRLAQQMRDGGAFEPLVLMADWDAPEPVAGETYGVRTVRWQLRSCERGMGMKARLAYGLWERRFRKQFARFCREHDIQAVNLHYPLGISFMFERVLKSVAPHIPLLLSFHGSDVSNLAALNAAEKNAWRRLLEGSGAVVTCSRELAKRIERALATQVRHQVVYSGVDAASFVHPTALPMPSPRVILHVGKFDYNKGHDVLIDAFARIANAFPDTMLHLVGASHGYLDSLRAQATRMQLAERVKFFTDIPFADMPAHFSEASVFAFPSRQEGFGLVLLEAGSYALPVVASRVGGIPELIHDGDTGLLVEPENAAALAEALRTLLGNPALASSLGQRLAARVKADFSWANTCIGYEQLIRASNQAARGRLSRRQACP